MADPHKLDSWKEISAYLGRDERTVQRWAKQRGLPVHRVPGGKRGGIFAYANEIDDWLNRQPAPGLEYPANSRVASSPLEPARDLPQWPSDSAPSAVPPPLHARPWLTRLVVLVSLTAVLMLAISAYYPWLTATPATPSPARVIYSTSSLVALDQTGGFLWSFDFPNSFIPLDPNVPPETNQTRVTDFDRDGENEILSVASWLSPTNPTKYLESAFFRFAASGRLLQRYAPADTLTFAGRPFAPPWVIRAVLFDQAAAEPSIWLAFSHHTWWPAMLIRLDRRGREAARFTHSGWIKSLAILPRAGERFVLAGGINNQAGAAMLAVLPENVTAASGPPDAAGRYSCYQCPAQPPHRYYLFPPSDVARAARLAYNQVVGIAATSDGILVYTEESPDGKTLIYEFNADFQYLGVSPSDYYAATHDQLFKVGRLDHPASACPELHQPPSPLEWRNGAWHKLQPAKR